MGLRHLAMTARTTLDFVDARAVGDCWRDDAIAALDVESPEDEETVALQLELDEGDCEHVAAHADVVTLSPDEARTVAADLEAAATAAERGEAMTSGRSR